MIESAVDCDVQNTTRADGWPTGNVLRDKVLITRTHHLLRFPSHFPAFLSFLLSIGRLLRPHASRFIYFLGFFHHSASHSLPHTIHSSHSFHFLFLIESSRTSASAWTLQSSRTLPTCRLHFMVQFRTKLKAQRGSHGYTPQRAAAERPFLRSVSG